MARKDEIQQAIPKDKFDNFYKQVAYEFGFEQGAKWADTTMLDKVCGWLKENADRYIDIKDGALLFKRSLCVDLKRAMIE